MLRSLLSGLKDDYHQVEAITDINYYIANVNQNKRDYRTNLALFLESFIIQITDLYASWTVFY
jgi:hypothetical protein